MRGPLPEANTRRRNAPTIPTTSLPASGRPGRAPRVPSHAKLGKAGQAWWRWAWATPQAAAWSGGHESVIARRASLEDDLVAIEDVDGIDFEELTGRDSDMERAIRRVAGLATGRLQICKEMRELDDRLGLTPKAMAQLRWTISDEDAEPGSDDSTVVVPERWRNAAAG